MDIGSCRLKYEPQGEAEIRSSAIRRGSCHKILVINMLEWVFWSGFSRTAML